MRTSFERGDMDKESRETALELLTKRIQEKLGADKELKTFVDSEGWAGHDVLDWFQHEVARDAEEFVSRQTGIKFTYPEVSSAFVQAMINLGKYSGDGRGRSRFSPKG